MKYRQLGNSNLIVSELCLGGNIFGYFTNLEETKKIIDFAFEQGINFIDTANVYGNGISESFIGEAIKGSREKFIIATKAGMRSDQKAENVFTKEYILKSADESLKRLQTDYIDLYQIHNFDFLVPLEETLQALNQLIEEGKVRSVGCSNYNSQQLKKALALQFKNKFISIQLPYNIINRDIEEKILPLCNQTNVGVLAYQSLARGILTAKYKHRKNINPNQRAGISSGLRAEITDELIDFTNQLEKFAHHLGYSATQLAIAWILSRKEIGSAIVGVRNVEQLKECIKGANWKLSKFEIDEVEGMLKKYKKSVEINFNEK